ncbi:hypothetical protein [Streptomyces sp. NPDC002057]|uniref:hypothetical protein n=1 Tax=Streptomyces sp. NPDC002057 TaxID=3154664 RepID=UPI00332239B3
MTPRSDDTPVRARLRLDAALAEVATAFRGATAAADEVQCDCHWGGEEELARLKSPDLELDPDLLHRTWSAPDWRDKGAVLRRVLPQFSVALVHGLVEPMSGMEDVGRVFAWGGWDRWPARQSAAVGEFLHAWWAYSLVETDPAVPVHELLVLCAEASGTLDPWLAVWETTDHPAAHRHLAEAADQWDHDLLADELPWRTWHDEDRLRTGLAAWLVRHAHPRLRSRGAPGELLHRIRLIGLSGPARWEDPHWPNHRY